MTPVAIPTLKLDEETQEAGRDERMEKQGKRYLEQLINDRI